MSAPEATEVTAPSGFVHVGWRWKTKYAVDWSTAYSIEKPELGFTPEYAAQIIWEPLFTPDYSASTVSGLEKLYSGVLFPDDETTKEHKVE